LYGVETTAEPNDEAVLRTVIGRAYYAVLLQARDLLIRENRLARGEKDIHKIVPDLLLSDKRRERVRWGNQIARIKELRKKADYEADFPDVAQQARTVLRMTQSISETLPRD
jgi:uncharacterized protein (UPF0332 family)